MSDNKKIMLTAEDCVKVDNKLFFLSMDVNMIFSFDLETEQVEIVDSIPEEAFSTYRLGIKIVSWGEELIFIPMAAKKIWRYNITTKKWKGYTVAPKKEAPSSKFFQGVLYGDELFCIGGWYPAIVAIDLNSEKIQYIEAPYKEFMKKKGEVNDSFFRTDLVQEGEVLYLASCLDNKVLKFNMSDKTFQVIEVGKKGNRYSGMAWDGEYYYLAPRYNTPIVKWDGASHYEEIILPEVFKNGEFSFLGVICVGDKKVFPGVFAPHSLELVGEKVEVVDKGYYIYKYLDKDFLVSLDNERNLEITVGGKKTSYKFCVDEKVFIDYAKEKYGEVLFETPYYESNVPSLSVFLELIKEKNAGEEDMCGNEVGNRIWKEIQ